MRDSRRLTGPNLIWERPGAILDAACPDDKVDALIDAWEDRARRILDSVGWESERVSARRFAGGASLVISAPVDALYAATEVNEWAFEAARARTAPDLREGAARLRQLIQNERNPALLALSAAATERGVAFLSDDEEVSVGLGRGSRTWPVSDIPSPSEVDWTAVSDIPVALITGTNGKSTTVRLLASIARESGKVAGMTCTDGIEVGDELVDKGDYSGPAGARAVLRDRRVEVALLETARGGILRRGLGVRRATAALVTNVGEDHLGEFGVADFQSLVDTKLVVRRAIGPGGRLVLNAEDPALLARGKEIDLPVAWFSTRSLPGELTGSAGDAGNAAFVEEGKMILRRQGQQEILAEVEEIPASLGGAARHNVSNALAAALVADALGSTTQEIAAGLKAFTSDPARNPGRGNLFDLGGALVMIDFAHNPHGLRALFDMAAALPAKRRLVLLGQAGDRDDGSILALVRETWKARPDRILIKEMTKYLRGREPGEVAGMIEAELRRLGAGSHQMERASSEMEGVRKALAWARPGDLLLLLSHSDRSTLLKLMARLRDRGWRPGERLP
jgi:UDP-N-acetylmuramyl tripeptide synthase